MDFESTTVAGSIPAWGAKRCSRCKLDKDIRIDFATKRGKPQAQCRACMKLASDAHYQANKAKIKARSRMRNEREMAKARVWICQFLETHHCVDCGESDYRVLEFDHRDAAEKLGGVSALMRQGRSLRVLMDEVAKCDVRCANCHRRRTIVQLGWWRV